MSTQARQPIAAQVLQHAAVRPTHGALAAGEHRVDYATLAAQLQAVARRLDGQTQAEHHTLALSVRDPLAFVPAFLGARLCGWHLLVLDPAWPVSRQRETARRLAVDLCWDDAAVAATIEHARPGDADSALASAAVDLQAPFYTGFTSGSEGEPKGFSRHENSWLHSFETDAACYRLGPDDTVFCPGKLAHSLFLYATLRALTSGAAVRFSDGLSLASQRAALRAAPQSALFAVPAQLQALAADARPYPGVRLLVSAGAKLSPRQRRQLVAALPQAQIIECYGSSELSYIALSLPRHRPPAESVGRPCADVEVRIADDRGRALPAGTKGRILVRSPLRFIGYAAPGNRTHPGAMREHDGFLDSGDTGHLDKDGFLYVTGRSDRMMLVGGHSVFPEEIEARLQAHPAVASAAVFPVDDARRGQRPVAVLQFHPKATTERRALLDFAAAALPPYALPRHFYTADSWPRTVSDKTDLKRLQAAHAEGALEPLQ